MKERLRSELIRRCKTNPQYSLRAFARSLEMDASVLSKILQGKRELGPRAAKRIAAKLGLSPEETRALVDSSAGLPPEDPFQKLSDDVFEIVADWYHFAILELMRVKGFKSDAKWIARRLGVPVPEVQAAIDRLARVGMLKVSRGKWLKTTPARTSSVLPMATSAAHKRLQRQILEKSLVALEDVPLALRSHTAMTMAIDPAKLDEARERIKKFRRSLSRFLSRGSPCSEVYHLGVNLYPVSQPVQRK